MDLTPEGAAAGAGPGPPQDSPTRPEDFARIKGINCELFVRGGHFATYHRIIDAQLREEGFGR
ncbi:hypothetical protein [Arthrobacter sp. Soil763]|uniref:hypothetical protein n=1 Tax=Arthrobacter sp. Soil763 TaxID=1736402 RepID=UPI0006FCAA05|nr:hypothetical protein [Arthrobacter sp. Soil763]KRE79353.1 hypothetical protein ASG71_04465 [Arthrobacter sp. Soil763]